MTSHVARIVLAAVLSAAAARAEPAPVVPGDTAENRALVHLDRGVAAYRAGDLRRAHAELVEANQLAPDRPNPYRWLALTEAALGDCDGALVDVEGFLSRVAADDPRVGELRALRERCLRSVRDSAARTVEPGAAAAAPSPPAAPPPAPAEPSLFRRWWFWTAVGAVAITAAGATYALTRDPPPRLPRVTCDPAGCHP
ncbi:MAG TPA: hypothetical protein VHW23_01310 [Kofleriaceae bacterium]|jgi:hypothetical protein|nr:hypothetical protein [Kofleriaceae bacterium]